MTTIKKLHFRGFKSFAKPLDLEFGNGFNTIIGPNGAGKSNVCDGICFVLGKMSAKGMRAEKSSNLIFNGGKKGSPMKEAEVSIFFDNEKKTFLLDAETIKISRIVRQNGQSVYKINDEVRTRQQIIDLLALAKIDPDGHNIVLQGDIVHFMEMRTEERRQVIEEISGIAVYEDKKQKALNELSQVEGKINEATIIMTEREAYLRELKKDRDQALKYKELEKNIKSNKATFLHVQLEEKKTKVADIEKKIADQTAQREKLNTKVKELKKTIDTKKKELQDISKEIEEKGEKEAIIVQKEVENSKTTIVKHTERLYTCKNEITKIEERKKQLKASLDDINKSIQQLEQSHSNINRKREEAKTKEERLQTDIQKFKEKYGVGTTTEGLEALEQKMYTLEEQLQKKTDERQEALQKKFQLEAEINQLDEQRGRVLKLGKGLDISKQKKEIENIARELQKTVQEDSVIATQLRDVKEKLMKQQQQVFSLQVKESGLRNSFLEDVAVKKMLSLNNPKIYGIISQLGKVEEKYSKALEVAAGPRIKSIVVEDDKVAADCIRLLKESRVGIATFLPLNKVKARADAAPITGRGVHGNALDLVSFDKKFKDVFSFVFGNTYVVDDVETARRMGIGKARMVTLDGDIMEVSGAMVGGFRPKSVGLGFQQKEVSENLSKSQKEVEQQEKLKATIEQRREEVEQQIARLRKLKSEMEGELIKRETSLGSLDSNKLQEQRENLAKDKIFSRVDALTKEMEKLQEALEIAKKQRNQAMEGMKGLANPQIASSLASMEERRQKIREEMVQYATEIKNIDTQITNIYKPEEERTHKIIKQHEKETQEFLKEAETLEQQLKQQQRSLQEQEEKATKFQKDYKNLFVKRNKTSEEIQKAEAQATVEEMKIREIQNKINDINITRAKIVAEKEALEKEFEEFRGVELRHHIALEKLKDEIVKFEKLMQDMGNINLRALEVYDNILKEYEELLKKLDKLKAEKEDVLQMMYEIESKKKDLFLQTYGILAKNFTSIFSSLSAKGEALLVLENEEDPLAAGVEIRVRLAGNKFLDIKSLSGGEKTLAALSFIFAIQEYHPASFYLMDEVDAALDKKNSELLSKLIAKYAQKAQYVLISHNDAIISEAEQIYGVSMQTNGISKVVSLKI
ncbi:chromosome segregation protein SMC [Candidatus Woesearchaeota archaeon]|nr:chromosome segregation protein SMC [Candidatus Woesearchaeota archaeon]